MKVGLATGAGLVKFAVVATLFVIGVLWLLDSLEPPARDRYDLKINTGQPAVLRPQIEAAFRDHDVPFELLGSTRDELHYEVTMPFAQKIRKVSNAIKALDDAGGTSVEWQIKKQKPDRE